MESWSRGGASLVSGLPPSPPQLGPESCRGMTGKKEERGASRGGGWLRVPGWGWWVGVSPAQTGPKPLGFPWPHWMLVVPPQGARQRGSGSVRTFIGHTPGLGLGWGLSSQVVRRMETQ